MTREAVRDDYFDWMYHMVTDGRYDGPNSYRRLLRYLHNCDFVCSMKSDKDRVYDGTSLRHRFAIRCDKYPYNYIEQSLDGPCSVLEMMVALAIRCEETIMSDAKLGDRTAFWFWKMINTLGLGGMTDNNYDEIHVDWTVCKFLDRDYEPDGTGGLFKVRGTKYDFRRMTIWKQMCCFLDTMI